jgi:predicted AAA+ superfamily ATPase
MLKYAIFLMMEEKCKMRRKIYNKLLEWKSNDENKKPLMVLGVRQCGKTYVIKDFCKNEFENVCVINLLERDDIIELFSRSINSEEKYNILKTMLNYDIEDENTVLFIDEIQESEDLISQLKFFCENHNNVNIICAGSLLGVKLKRLKKSFPVGKVWMIDMFPMDFEEFLVANNREKFVDLLKDCFNNNKFLGSPLHEELLRYYRIYLLTGGMPEAIQNIVDANLDYVKYDTKILKNILASYYKDMRKHVKNEAEALKIERVYRTLPSQLMNASKKFQLSIIDVDARNREYETAIDWLMGSNMIIKCECVSLPEIPLKGFVDNETFKFYLSDVGILCTILGLSVRDIVTDNISLYKGIIAENFVANQLLCNGFDLFYWKNTATAEVDFLLYTADGVIPVEVKAGENTQSKSLKVYMEKYDAKYAIRISTKDFGYDPKTKIKSVPLYATFLIKDNFNEF